MVEAKESLTFGDIIRTRRRELDLTLEEVGKKCGVSKGTVCRWESGIIGNLNSNKVAKLSAALQVSPEYLMGWTEDPSVVFNGNLAVALADLNPYEVQLVLNYISFIKSQRPSMKGLSHEDHR